MAFDGSSGREIIWNHGIIIEVSVPKRHQDGKYRELGEVFGSHNSSMVKAYNEAKKMLDVLLAQLYTRGGLGVKKSLTLFKRRQLAVVRSKYDQPIARIGQFLRAVVPECLDANEEPRLEDMLISFYVENYKWIDEPTAIWIVSQIYSLNFETKGEIFYDRHFHNGLPSEGENGEPYESISFSRDITTLDLMDFLDWHRFYIDNTDDQSLGRFGHWDLATIRKIIIHNLYYRYCKYHYDPGCDPITMSVNGILKHDIKTIQCNKRKCHIQCNEIQRIQSKH